MPGVTYSSASRHFSFVATFQGVRGVHFASIPFSSFNGRSDPRVIVPGFYLGVSGGMVLDVLSSSQTQVVCPLSASLQVVSAKDGGVKT